MQWYYTKMCIACHLIFVWVQCHIHGASATQFAASITLLSSFWPVTCLIKANAILLYMDALAHASSRPIFGSITEAYEQFLVCGPRVSHKVPGYHCSINADVFRDICLFEGAIQITKKRTSLTVSIHRQICIIS